jgi:16S rRNA (cytidine1402-2'-O)-methyltransferase
MGRRAAPGGTLYVVATPIGNLADVTLRALDVLRAVPLVAAEDTRVTRRLLARYEIEARLTSFHARNATQRLEGLLAHLRGGSDLALVTDAGTPGVSDPGQELVRAWSAEGGIVTPLPGPSAVMAAVSGSGIAGPRWSFEGFLPRSGRERAAILARIAGDPRGSVLFESAGRLPATLRALAGACGADRPAAVGRELTKIHEEIIHGSLGVLDARAGAGAIEPRGEVVVVVGAWEGAAHTAAGRPESQRVGDDAAIEAAAVEVERLVREGRPRSAAAREVAERTGVPRRRLYRRAVGTG